MDHVLRALAEPKRRALLRLVRDRERAAGDLARAFPEVSRPAISQHLGVLRSAGLVSERRVGNRRLYRARVDALDDVRGFLAEFWDARLSRLQHAVATDRGADRATDRATDRARRRAAPRGSGPRSVNHRKEER